MTGPAIYDETPPYPIARRITRSPKPAEERALRDLRRAMTAATMDIARERRGEEQRKPAAQRWKRGA